MLKKNNLLHIYIEQINNRTTVSLVCHIHKILLFPLHNTLIIFGEPQTRI